MFPNGSIVREDVASEYAYTTLDMLLYDIAWKGINYNYLKTPNIYKEGFECNNTPSPINGISQSEYEDIKNGKYPNIQITEEDNNNDESNNQTTEQHNNTGENRLMFSKSFIEEGNYNVTLTIQAEGDTVEKINVKATSSSLENVLRTVEKETSIKFDMEHEILYNCIINGQEITKLLRNKGKMRYDKTLYINGEIYSLDYNNTELYNIQDGDDIIINFHSIIME